MPYSWQEGTLRTRIVGQPSEPTTQIVGNVPNLREDVYSPLINPEISHVLPPLIRIPFSFFSVKCQTLIDTGAAASFVCLSHLRKLLYDKLVQTLLNADQHLFANKMSELRMVTAIEHTINTGTSAPVNLPLRRTPPENKMTVRSHIDEMQSHNIIRESASPYAAPVEMTAKKKSGNSKGSLPFAANRR